MCWDAIPTAITGMMRPRFAATRAEGRNSCSHEVPPQSGRHAQTREPCFRRVRVPHGLQGQMDLDARNNQHHGVDDIDEPDWVRSVLDQLSVRYEATFLVAAINEWLCPTAPFAHGVRVRGRAVGCAAGRDTVVPGGIGVPARGRLQLGRCTGEAGGPLDSGDRESPVLLRCPLLDGGGQAVAGGSASPVYAGGDGVGDSPAAAPTADAVVDCRQPNKDGTHLAGQGKEGSRVRMWRSFCGCLS